ncbi:hypothetical protein J2W58_004954, partial [Pseudomonas psychrotolerans]|nr:hypothetical protein [Pseudomonas psychrotolerans]
MADGAKITTKATQGKSGTWLLDPTDFTVSAGSSAASASGIGASTLAANLQNGNVTLQTVSSGSDTGKLSVNSAVNWSANTTLTLNAHGDLYLNAPITATGTNAGLALNYGGYIQNSGSVTAGSDYHVSAPVTLSGSNASLSINGQNYGLLHSLADIQAINSRGLGGRYALAQNLDAAGTTYTSALVGTSVSPFSGTFTGLGHTLANLKIQASTSDYVGVFASTTGTVRDLNLSSLQVTGQYYVGGLAGTSSGVLDNIHVAGTLVGNSTVGGLVGEQDGGTIRNASSSASVSGASDTIGGLVGYAYHTSISNVYATGAVSGSNNIGGLVGASTSTSTSNAYATGAVNGVNYLGGLVGANNGPVSYAYATGAVTGSGTSYRGGLLGANTGGSISYVYATGAVNGSGASVGGLIGTLAGGTVQNAYWDVDSTRQSTGVAYVNSGASATNVSSVNSSNRYNASSYANLASFAAAPKGADNVQVGTDGSSTARWIILDGSTRPFLASEYSTQIGNLHQLQLVSYDRTANYGLIRNIDASATASGGGSSLWSSSGFVPLAQNYQRPDTESFIGTFDGNNLTISGIYINRSRPAGLFYSISDQGVVQNLGLLGGTITTTSTTGSLAAGNFGLLQNVFATTNVTGGYTVGGVVGVNYGQLLNAYSTGTVQGMTAGGIAGANYNATINSKAFQARITNTYAGGTISGSSAAGGIAGLNRGSIQSSFYALSDAAGNGINANLAPAGQQQGGTLDALSGGKTWTQLTNLDTYSGAGWSLDASGGTGSTWRLYAGFAAPLLRSFLTPLTVTSNISGLGKTYDGIGFSSTTSSYTVGGTFDSGLLFGSSLRLATIGKDAGSYTTDKGNLQVDGLYSSQLGYDISFTVTGGITITPKSITGSITAQDKTYDGTTNATTLGILNGVIGSDVVSLTTIGSFADKNAGNGKQVNVSGVLSGSGAGNYVLGSTNVTTTADIAAKAITGSITAQDKIYDGTTSATTTGTLNGVIGGDTVSLASNGSFADKNAGTGKQVNVSGTLAGTDAGNYRLTGTNATTTANITAKAITGSITAQDKTYDGTTSATTSGTSSGFISGDAVSLTTSGSFADKNA